MMFMHSKGRMRESLLILTYFIFIFCRPQSDFESFLKIGVWFNKYCKYGASESQELMDGAMKD